MRFPALYELYVASRLESVATPVDIAHVAGCFKCSVESQRSLQRMRCLTGFAKIEIFVKQRAIHRMSTIINYAHCTLHGIKTSEISDTLISDDYIY